MTGTSDTLETNPEIPDDHEALSLNKITLRRVSDTFENCYYKNELTDTFAMDHVLSKLN